jgi:hypothetical protein
MQINLQHNADSSASERGQGPIKEESGMGYPNEAISKGSPPGLVGVSDSGDGVEAISTSGNGLSASSGEIGVYAKGMKYAGYFEGDVVVTGYLDGPTIQDIQQHLNQVQDSVPSWTGPVEDLQTRVEKLEFAVLALQAGEANE